MRAENFFGSSDILREVLEGERDSLWVLGARRLGPSVAYLRIVNANQATNRIRSPIGMSAIRARQSGVMKIAATPRRASPIVCGDGEGEGTIAPSALLVAGVEDGDHDPERRAERDEHRHAGPLDLVVERLREPAICHGKDHAGDPDVDRVPASTKHLPIPR